MEQTVESSRWFGLVFQPLWLFALMPVGLSLFAMRLLWQRWRAGMAVHRVITLTSQAMGIPLYACAHPQLTEELARARRYQHPLAVMVMSLNNAPEDMPRGVGPGTWWSSSAATHLQRLLVYQLTLSFVGSLLREALRESDMVTYNAAHHQYVIVFPESTSEQALQAGKRLHALCYQHTRLLLHFGVAEFPADGMTLATLVSAAQAAKGAPQLPGAVSGVLDE